MKIAILSDLHIEVSAWEVPARTLREAALIVLAGDIGVGTSGIRWARKVFPEQRIIYVAGNHEYYGSEIPSLQAEMREQAAALGIDFLENDVVVIDGVRFLGCTLWTDFKLFGAGKKKAESMRAASTYMNDFSRIRMSPLAAFRPEDSVRLHVRSRQWLEHELDKPFDGLTVVVTHHTPSFNSIAPRFQQDLCTAAFSSHLDTLVARTSLWIHGHTHNATDYRIGDDPQRGRVICNPRGYQVETYSGWRGERTGWHSQLLVDLDRVAEFRSVIGARHVCEDCAQAAGLEPIRKLSVTAHAGNCDVCGVRKEVMSVEDFG